MADTTKISLDLDLDVLKWITQNQNTGQEKDPKGKRPSRSTVVNNALKTQMELEKHARISSPLLP
jgi:hypothetical protein